MPEIIEVETRSARAPAGARSRSDCCARRDRARRSGACAARHILLNVSAQGRVCTRVPLPRLPSKRISAR
jgi:hypothetical protein